MTNGIFMNQFNGYKYLIYSLSFIIVTYYKVFFDLKLESDNLNYFNIYNNILNNPFPFYFEMVNSGIMYFFKIVGLDFFVYTFLKLLIFIPAFILIDRKIINNNIISIFFLISTLYPPFIEMMIFLSRQSLSINFLIFCLLSSDKKRSWFWFLLSVMTHISSLIYFPFLTFTHKLFKFLVSKTCAIFLLVFLFYGYFHLSLSSIIIELIDKNLHYFPEIIRHNVNMKIGFYYVSDNNFDELSILRLMFIVINILFFLFLFDERTKYNLLQERIIGIYIYSLVFLILVIDTSIMAMRVGFFSYFFCISWFIIYLNFTKKIKI